MVEAQYDHRRLLEAMIGVVYLQKELLLETVENEYEYWRCKMVNDLSDSHRRGPC